MPYLENIILQLFPNLNPKEENFKSDINRKSAINLLHYSSNIKQSNVSAIIKIWVKMLTKIYENEKLYKIHIQTQQIIQVASHYLKEENKKEITNFFQNILRKINL